tara:strand:+ start:11148 stop:11558 length:411 start_codon:yes stop_codon:yes gene_type:complete
MNLLHKVSLIFWVVAANLIFSQPDNDIIIEDTWDPRIDKISHATASFGFYYTFRYYENSKFESFLYTSILGLSFEIYQINDPNEEDSDFRGVSIQDIGYNLLGVGLALGMDILIDEIKKTRKEKSKKRKIKNYNFP